MVIIVVITVAMITHGDEKSNIKTLSDDMLLVQSDFPSLPSNGGWQRFLDLNYVPSKHEAGSRSFSPAQCGAFGWSREGVREAGGIEWVAETGDTYKNWTYGDSLMVPPAAAFEVAAMRRAFDSCGNYNVTVEGKTNTASVHRLELPGIPDWAVAFVVVWEPSGNQGRHADASIQGIHRGVLIEAFYGPVPGDSLDLDADLKGSLARVFNK